MRVIAYSGIVRGQGTVGRHGGIAFPLQDAGVGKGVARKIEKYGLK